ncbi:MAG: hypothetical protein HOB37_17300 [Rhodospirillaceae bacterium]|jgi:hypothetical protein|nr:hypothetical protein [Rhodospirillaceae bacterium]MBT3908766.1 hypothetical protein [Rhodospirillaceae bacterium]MBT6361472.1 hypothetical protein [Rhodospirillaceae bacterium]MBT6610194.1 hypothetical protein [Rhodospirillaceae bacterium]MBT6883726.1 hypothetical protein [Rhodospirillaceae bacterium]
MALKKNPLKLNKLQLRTLALAQVLAADEKSSTRDEATGDVTLLRLPHAHGDHVHIGGFVVSARDASGFSNPAVWTALERKGLSQASDGISVTLTVDGVGYDTGLGDRFMSKSDH